MIIGYARTSTTDQKAGLEAQIRDLQGLGCEKLYQEHAGATGPRPVLEQALDFAREGDTLVVMKLDRLARSVVHMGEIVKRLEDKGVHLRIVAMGVDTSTATGKLMLNVLTSVAQFEREMMLERQREGIAKAKAEGAYKGRKPTAREKTPEILKLSAEGRSADQIAGALDISRSSVFAILKEHRATTTPKAA